MAPSSDPPSGGFRSLTTRLIAWTLVAVGGVYVATLVVSNGLARRMAIAAAERDAVNETEAAVSRVEDVLHSVEERTLAVGEALSVLGPREADVDPLLPRFVEGNRDLYGAAIAWAPEISTANLTDDMRVPYALQDTGEVLESTCFSNPQFGIGGGKQLLRNKQILVDRLYLIEGGVEQLVWSRP